MPNWCEGTLKIRGEKEDIVRFLKKGIQSVSFLGDVKESTITEDDNYLRVQSGGNAGFHICNTRRAFIEEDDIWYEYDYNVLALEFKQAWGIEVDILADISKEFNIDLKIYAYERGMEFNQDIEIHRGEIIRNKEIKFSDYVWECTNPNIGG